MRVSALEAADQNLVRTCMTFERMERWVEVVIARNPTMSIPTLAR